MKILFLATDPLEPTGYAKISYWLTNFLSEQPNVELYHLAIDYDKQPTVSGRKRHSNVKYIDSKTNESDDIYGPPIINKLVSEIKPDVLFIYNDILVVYRNLLELNKMTHNMKIVLYLDVIYEKTRTDILDFIRKYTDDIYVFSEHWTQYIKDSISLPHWIDPHIKKIDQNKAREAMGIDLNNFIIVNANRNSSHKQHDITIRAFIRLYKIVPKEERKNLRLILICSINKKEGFNLITLIKDECKYENLTKAETNDIIFTHIIHMSNITDQDLFTVYNAGDVGINTASIEGFGLCNIEMASLDKPQIVSDVGGMKDIYKEYGIKIKPTLRIACSLLESYSQGGYKLICDADKFTEQLLRYYNNKDLLHTEGQQLGEYVRSKYKMENILDRWWSNF